MNEKDFKLYFYIEFNEIDSTTIEIAINIELS